MPEALAPTIMPLLSPDQFAALLGIGRRTLQTWRAAGKLPEPDLAEGRVLRWKPETIDRWLLERGQA